MFSTDSFRYLKSLASKYRENLPRPTTFEDEFIMYAETLVKGLNFNTLRKYFLEYALPQKKNQEAMEALVLRTGWANENLYLRIRTTEKGNFFLELHTSLKQFSWLDQESKQSFRNHMKSLLDEPGFSRYFSMHSENSGDEEHHFIRYEMPLRQMRSRNLVEYSIFIIERAKPFMEAALKMREESREAVAA